ncbi:MAG TPA: hypothetical protein PKD86_05370 [Gemmatales bacterium]|nr:hypothetical protein [Gemmatales bacterium]
MWSLVAMPWVTAMILLGSASSQPNMTFMPKFPLFMDKNVPGELELTADQERAIKELMQSVSQDLPGGGPQRVLVRVVGDTSEIENLDDEIDRILHDKQRQRLRELWLQRQGLMTLTQDSVAKDLALTPDQREKVRRIREEFGQAIMEQGPVDFQAPDEMKRHAEKVAELRQETQKKLGQVLTDSQKETWKKLQGREFKFATGGE